MEENNNPDIIYIEETPEEAPVAGQETIILPTEETVAEPAADDSSKSKKKGKKDKKGKDKKEADKPLEQSSENPVIDLGAIFSKLWHKKIWFLIMWIIVGGLSAWHILGIPRTFTTTTRIAPEASEGPESSLGSIASSFGINIGDIGGGTDAIYPMLYPDLLDDNGFVSRLFDVRIESEDGVINTTYYDYLAHYQSRPWYAGYLDKLQKYLPKDETADKKKKKKVDGDGNEEDEKFNPYYLNKEEDRVVNNIRNSIKFDYDMKTSCITISVSAQDRMVCKEVADSVRERLQAFITEYRTKKARADVNYYKKLSDDAKAAYEKVRRQYAAFSDANTDITLPSLQSKMDDMENDMQLKYNAYTTLNTQYQAAQAKLQEYTPAFTLLQGAAVPMKASGPKRMIFVAAMLILSTIILSIIFLRKLFFRS